MPRPPRTDRPTRRRLLAATGVAVLGGLAGCSSGGGNGGGGEDADGGETDGDTTSMAGDDGTQADSGEDGTSTAGSDDGMLPGAEFPAPTDSPAGLAVLGDDLWVTASTGSGTTVYRMAGFTETVDAGWRTDLPGGTEVTGGLPNRRSQVDLANAATNELVTYSLDQGQQVARTPMPVTRPTGLTTDFNGRVWVVDHREDGDYVVALSASGDEIVNEYAAPGESAWGLSMADGTMYVTDPDAEQVHALETRQFTVEESYDVGLSDLRGVVFHEKLWVVGGGDAPTVAGFGL